MKIIFILLLLSISCCIFANDPIYEKRLNHFKYQVMKYSNPVNDKIFTKSDYVMSGISIGSIALMNVLYLTNNKSWTNGKSDKVYRNTPLALVVLDGMLLATQIRYYLKKS